MLRQVSRIFVFFLGILPLSAFAQQAPAFDCAKAESSAEKLVCSDPKLGLLDQRLAKRFSAALAVAQSQDEEGTEAENLLRATQRGWISGRDECWKEPDLEACVRQSYLRREAELVARYLLEEPVSVQTFVCEGGAADTFVAYQFNTEMTAIRFERGDTVAAGALLSSDKPQEFYLANAGNVSFAGDQAVFSDPYGAEQSCQLAK
jgi:uncharacterized protein